MSTVTRSRVLIRVLKSPVTERGELLALYIDSRTAHDEHEVVYSITKGTYRVEHHRRLMWKSRRASIDEVERARDHLLHMGEIVLILRNAPPPTDETPAHAPINLHAP